MEDCKIDSGDYQYQENNIADTKTHIYSVGFEKRISR